jgi:hypothetical protein
MHHAGPAGAGAAAKLRTIEFEVVAKHIEQRVVGISRRQVDRPAVQHELHHLPPMTAVRIDLEIRTATPKVLNDHAKFDRAGGGVLDLRPSPGHRRNSPILHRVNRSNNSPADHARCPNSGRFLFSSA